MKTLAVLCLFCATAYALPAGLFDGSNESDLIDPVNKKTPSVVEVDVGDSGEDSFFFPQYFRHLFFNRFPQFDFGDISSWFLPSFLSSNTFWQVPKDAKLVNSTTSVEIVNGKKITKNTTIYEIENSAGFVKYEVFDVTNVESDEASEKVPEDKKKPEIGGEVDTRKTEEETTSVKNDNNSFDNEILREEVSPPDQSDDLIA